MNEDLTIAIANLIDKAYSEGVKDSVYKESSGLKVFNNKKTIAAWPETVLVTKIINRDYKFEPKPEKKVLGRPPKVKKAAAANKSNPVLSVNPELTAEMKLIVEWIEKADADKKQLTK